MNDKERLARELFARAVQVRTIEEAQRLIDDIVEYVNKYGQDDLVLSAGEMARMVISSLKADRHRDSL